MKSWVAVWLLAVFSAVTAPAPAWAGGAVSIVKVLSFGCPICRASEVYDNELKSAVKARGGQFAYAAMPAAADATARELAYYAARDLGYEAQARQSLYKGSQDYGLPLSDPVQATVWLQDDLGLDGSQLSQGITGPKAQAALDRALALAAQGGVQALPTYLLVRDGAVIDVIAPGTDGLFALKKRVLDQLNKETTSKP